MRALLTRLRATLAAPRDIAALAVFRMLYGAIGLVGAVRFIANGWVHDYFLEPTFQFKYWGFGWVHAWPAWGMYAHFAAMGVLALMVALGLFYRVAIVLYVLGFAYAELIDVSTYLNHYYLITLLGLLLAFVPAHRAWSLDVMRRPALRATHLPAFYTYLLRLQVAVVYVYAGLAKLGADWLLRAEPLDAWLSSRAGLPVIGPWLEQRWIAYAMSWAGFLFDSTIVFFLLARRTRPWAYGVVIAFHLGTQVLFPIGMFPTIMISSALLFFSSGWPRRWLALAGRLIPVIRKRAQAETGSAVVQTPALPGGRWLGVAAVYAVVQVLMPLRCHLYDGDVLWHEQGMRYSWKVMVREKNGSVTYLVRTGGGAREFHVSPRIYLTEYQEREMSGQPDMILQLAHHIARDFRARGFEDVEVRAEALVALNGRTAAPIVDPAVDLARVQDGLLRAPWILPAPAPHALTASR